MASKKNSSVKRPNIPKNQLDGKGAFNVYPTKNTNKGKGKKK